MKKTNFLLAWTVCVILGSVPADASIGSLPMGVPTSAHPLALAPIAPVIKADPQAKRTNHAGIIQQSFRFLLVEHGFRMTQPKTRQELVGPFFKDYGKSVNGLGGWGDGDSVFVNYVAHPMQGATSGFIRVENDPHGRGEEFGRTKTYWHSRLKAMAWSAVYSTQFELGPFSESSIGNVGLHKGTAGWVDLIMTPVGGFGLMVAEDALDRFVLRGIESRTNSRRKLTFYRSLCNPSRTFSKMMQGRFPWSRNWRGTQGTQLAGPKEPSRDLGVFPEEKEIWPGPTLAENETKTGWARALVPFGLGNVIFPRRAKPVKNSISGFPAQPTPAAVLIIQQPHMDTQFQSAYPATAYDPNTRWGTSSDSPIQAAP